MILSLLIIHCVISKKTKFVLNLRLKYECNKKIINNKTLISLYNENQYYMFLLHAVGKYISSTSLNKR